MVGMQESGTLALGQGSGQRLGLFIFPKCLSGPCLTLSSVERAVSGEVCCIYYKMPGPVSGIPNLLMFLSEFSQHLTCFWGVPCIDYIGMRAGLIKNGVLPWQLLAQLLLLALGCPLVTAVVGTGLLASCR